MARLRCSCRQGVDVWGEVWWAGGRPRWVFFDDEKTSESNSQGLERCACSGKAFERKDMLSPPFPEG